MHGCMAINVHKTPLRSRCTAFYGLADYAFMVVAQHELVSTLQELIAFMVSRPHDMQSLFIVFWLVHACMHAQVFDACIHMEPLVSTAFGNS